MALILEQRPSDSSLVETIWRVQSERAGSFISVAASHWEMVVTKYRGKTTFTVRGPETKATPLHYQSTDAEWLGIRFKLGTFMPHLPPGNLRDRRDVILPEATSQSFWLHGSAWQFPDYENADVFVDRLVRAGLLVRDPVVVGEGTRLFGGGSKATLKLVDTKRFSAGFAILTCQPVRRA